MVDGWRDLSFDLKKEISKAFIEKIEFHDDEVTIRYRENLVGLQ